MDQKIDKAIELLEAYPRGDARMGCTTESVRKFKAAIKELLFEARTEELNFVGRCGVFGRSNAINMAARLNEYLSDRHAELQAINTNKTEEAAELKPSNNAPKYQKDWRIYL